MIGKFTMRIQLEQRLNDLKAEFQADQKMLAELEARQAQLRDTLLRISGAIQVLEEVLSDPPSPTNGVVPQAEVSNGAGTLLNVAN